MTEVRQGPRANRVDIDAERRLVRRSQAGDRGAFDALIRAHRDRAYRLAYRLTGSHADADDVLQEAWLRGYRGITEFGGRARFGTWFFRILLRAAASHRRRLGRRADGEGGTALEGSEAVSGAADPQQRAAAHELHDALQEALCSLPADQRGAVVLVAFEGLSYAEAAEAQGCPEGTLAWRVAEARRRLARKLAPYLDSAGEAHHAM